MGKFLDMRTSQNASFTGGISASLSTFPTSPSLIGVIGLQTGSVSQPVVKLDGTMGIQVNTTTPFTVTILLARGSTFPTSGTRIYTAAYGIPTFVSIAPGAVFSDTVLNLTAADLLAPAATETVYTMLAYASTTATRVGPESFQGIAQNGSLPAGS
ncbi:hypothetical protein [Marininema halotolerans]|uniref:BclA C-terminal domain-containing protein n=1 Tax=Marininema halotolerans TaxID=1155944 RepID=A0A1I6RP88_9BACL|nr:hypothetical protein [Marininema halotolerans]SFS66537.1 hypothetical protein SAMN05444972_105259 [Marininema halotolerans]